MDYMDMSDVIEFPGTSIEGPESILKKVVELDIKEMLIIGEDANGNLYATSSSSNAMYLNWLTDKVKQFILENY